jgi:hypothetical protein
MYAYTYVGIFLVLATSLTVAYQHPATRFSAAPLGWYSGLTTFVLVILGLSIWLRHTYYQRLIPRIHVLSAFVLWVTLVIASTLTSDVAAQYVLLLLEAGSLFLLLALVAQRIRRAFAPQTPGRWLTGTTIVLSILVVVLSPTVLNYSLTVERGIAVFTSGPAHIAIVAAGFFLVFIALCYIPLGRPSYVLVPTTSVGPLIFSSPPTPTDCNLADLVAALVSEHRRQLIKRGVWLHYRNYLHTDTGIISTQPKSLEQLMSELLDYAAHQNQTRGISAQLFNDTRHPYVHTTITYTVNTHQKKPLKQFATHATELGGHLTISREERTTTLTLSFPLQW